MMFNLNRSELLQANKRPINLQFDLEDRLDNSIQQQTNEDLKAFERRLTEILACYQPQTKRWRIILLLTVLSTSITAFQWLVDPQTEKVSFLDSLNNHLFFTFNCIGLIILFIFGIHRKVVAPAIIVSRIKSVLENFNMSCDHNGRLILKRNSAPNNSMSYSNSFHNGTPLKNKHLM